MRYKLRTLLIVLALGPPVLAFCWFHSAEAVFAACCIYYFVEASDFVRRNTPRRT